MSRKFALALMFLLARAASVHADTPSPPMVDESVSFLRLVALGSSGYEPYAEVWVDNQRDGDSVSVAWKSKGKTIATTKCNEDRHCSYSGDAFKLVGPMTADVIYWDDRAEKESVLRTFRFEVHKTGPANWQIIADDLLGGAWVEHAAHQYADDAARSLRFHLWFTSKEIGVFSLRCSVDGTPLPDDIYVGHRSIANVEATDPKNRTYHFRKLALSTNLHWGKPRRESTLLMVIDHPGAWECRLRNEGKTFREFRFTVTPDGRVANDEMQAGKNPVPTVEDTVFIDSRMGKDAASLDERFDPTAYKKSLQYGLPWPDHPKVKTIHAAAPAKFGPSL